MTFETKSSDKIRNTNSQTQYFQRVRLFEWKSSYFEDRKFGFSRPKRGKRTP